MYYIFINTHKGEYGILHSRGKIEETTKKEVTVDFLRQHFTGFPRKVKPGKATFTNEKYIILPVQTGGIDQICRDPELKGRIKVLNQQGQPAMNPAG